MDDEDHRLVKYHAHLFSKHAHSHFHQRYSRKLAMERDLGVQTALDVIIETAGVTVGDVLLGSLPSEPTTVSLPGFGALTLSSFVPAGSTTDAYGFVGTTSSPTPAHTAASTKIVTAMSLSSSSAFSTRTPTSNVTTSALSITGSVVWNAAFYTSSSSTFSTTFATTSSSIPSSSGTPPFSIYQAPTSTTSSRSSITSSSPTSSTVKPSTNPTSDVAGGAGGSPSQTSIPSGTTTATSSKPKSNAAGPIAGGVVGGVGGAALFGILIFLLLRLWRKHQVRGQRLLGGTPGGDEEARSQAATGPGGAPRSTVMTQRSSSTPLAAALGRFRPDSMQTTSTTTGGTSSDRGFQKIGGRKLTSVLASGGDGFEEPVTGRSQTQYPPAGTSAQNNERSPSSHSFYRDGLGHYGGEGINARTFEPTFPSTAAAAASHRPMHPPPSESSMAVGASTSVSNSDNPFNDPIPRNPNPDQAVRFFSSSPDSEDTSEGIRSPTPGADEGLTIQQGPSRTPIISSGGFLASQRHQPAPFRPGLGPDGLGRSRPSMDGSRNSRFSEAL